MRVAVCAQPIKSPEIFGDFDFVFTLTLSQKVEHISGRSLNEVEVKHFFVVYCIKSKMLI